MNREIRKKRREIDKIDLDILRLLHQRARLSREIGALKAAAAAPPFVPTREQEVLENLQSQERGPFPAPAITVVFREIISACRYVQEETQVQVLDERLGISYSAALAALGSTVTITCLLAPDQFLSKLEQHPHGMGVLPYPSPHVDAGPVWEQLLSGTLNIIQDLRYGPSLVMASRRPLTIEKVARLFIAKEVFPVVRTWLGEQPQTLRTEMCMTPENALENLVQDNSAAILTEDVALCQSLSVLATASPLPPVPLRRLFVLSRQPNLEFRKGLSAAFIIPLADKATSIMPLLKPFERNNLPISNLDRISLHDSTWHELVLVEFQTPDTFARLDDAVRSITADIPFSRFLGCFPVVFPAR